MSHRPTATPDFPYTTLFRSSCHRQLGQAADPDVDLCAIASCGSGEATVIERVDQLGVVRMRLTCRSVDPDFRGRHQLRSEEHTSELQSRGHLVCRLLLE